MPTHPQQADVTPTLNLSPACQKSAFSPAFLLYKQAVAKYNNQHSFKK